MPLFGPQYKRSRKLIEIDITYLCNLYCINCNRSASQAPEEMHITIDRIQSFVNDSISLKHRWNRIRVLGGEPTLHPHFRDIIDCLMRYREWNGDCKIEVVTNGYGEKVQSVLDTLPKTIWIENSKKSGRIQMDFGPFSLAPCDDSKFSRADYRNGCAIRPLKCPGRPTKRETRVPHLLRSRREMRPRSRSRRWSCRRR